jgi:hypothetical protein
MKHINTFESFLNESAQYKGGPKFVEDYLTKMAESFSDIYAFYGWTREVFPLQPNRNIIDWKEARELADKASKKYPEYKIGAVGGDKRPEDHHVSVEVSKSINRKTVYNLLLGYCASMSEIDSMIRDFETKIKSLTK